MIPAVLRSSTPPLDAEVAEVGVGEDDVGVGVEELGEELGPLGRGGGEDDGAHAVDRPGGRRLDEAVGVTVQHDGAGDPTDEAGVGSSTGTTATAG